MVVVYAVLFGFFLVFIPFKKKVQRRTTGVYLAFVIALAFEMFGIPLSIYIITWMFGIYYPTDAIWGHTLYPYIGLTGMWIGIALNIVGIIFVIEGWKKIYREYWGQELEKRDLVTTGIYRFIRHPQYSGFLIITLGLLIHWATIPLVFMWPILLLLYYKLSKREEKLLEEEFNDKYLDYKREVPRFFPNPRHHL
ncbi:hypothetical protein LCGC14_0901980 [marine sediment metagenome]|uniref:Steroid 5-alpha reductase C-terminal domain-containing protein n=1 Tax=marine sediment metagenome TaxID=412755 RepID=A0A0F9PGV8_9ZZZZ|nr:isoprenylcysteine carboxylmethyltransferase family protein [bacterium]